MRNLKKQLDFSVDKEDEVIGHGMDIEDDHNENTNCTLDEIDHECFGHKMELDRGNSAPPPLKFSKAPVSRISRERKRHSFQSLSSFSPTSSPIAHNASLPLPLTNFTTPSPPPNPACRSRLFLKNDRKSIAKKKVEKSTKIKEDTKSVNINPFQPSSIEETNRKRVHSPAFR